VQCILATKHSTEREDNTRSAGRHTTDISKTATVFLSSNLKMANAEKFY
jgi:hypothetical protein